MKPTEGAAAADRRSLAASIDRVLPQTQCRQCGYPACEPYAAAIAAGEAAINQCAPGGDATIRQIAALTGRRPEPLDARHEQPKPPQTASIDESRCIGCTLCIQACPVDAVVGAPKRMHTVIESHCTGCDLCAPACPVDCIVMTVPGPAWSAWTPERAAAARSRYRARAERLERQARHRERRLPEPQAIAGSASSTAGASRAVAATAASAASGKDKQFVVQTANAADERKALIREAVTRVRARRAFQ